MGPQRVQDPQHSRDLNYTRQILHDGTVIHHQHRPSPVQMHQEHPKTNGNVNSPHFNSEPGYSQRPQYARIVGLRISFITILILWFYYVTFSIVKLLTNVN